MLRRPPSAVQPRSRGLFFFPTADVPVRFPHQAAKLSSFISKGRFPVKRLILFLLLASITAFAQRRVIIDTDPGVDDVMAILLALNSPELKVEALTVVPGNVDGKQGLENALKLVSLANRCDLPVAGGAQHPLNQ